MGFKRRLARRNGAASMNVNKTQKQAIATKAIEAVEGAVCYLQEELAPQGVTLTDAQAHKIIRQTATDTKTASLFQRA